MLTESGTPISNGYCFLFTKRSFVVETKWSDVRYKHHFLVHLQKSDIVDRCLIILVPWMCYYSFDTTMLNTFHVV